MKRIYVLIILTICWIGNLPCQTYEVIESKLHFYGLAEQGDEMVLYGSSLTWMKDDGTITHRDILLEGLPKGRIVEVMSDEKGGLFVLMANGLGYIDAEKNKKIIFNNKDFSGFQFNAMSFDKNNNLFCITNQSIIKVEPDHSFQRIYHSEKSKYFKKIAIHPNGDLYLADFNNIMILHKDNQLSKIEIVPRESVQRLQVTQTGRVLILGYRNIYECVDEEVVKLISASQINRRAKFYDGVFIEANDFWIFANNGNILRNNRGSWKNYVPPKEYDTGNMKADMFLRSNGDLWISLTNNFLMRFDGETWHEIDITNEQQKKRMSSVVHEGGRIIGRQRRPYLLALYNEGKFEPITMESDRVLSSPKVNADDEIHWCTEKGIFKWVNNSATKVVSGEGIKDYNFIDDRILFHRNQTLYVWQNGSVEEYEEGKSCLGWDPVRSVKIYQTWKKDLAFVVGSRNAQVCLFDGKDWSRITSIEGKSLQGVHSIQTHKDKTYLISKYGSIALYDVEGWQWLRYEAPPPSGTYGEKIRGATLINDGSLWIMDRDQNFTVVIDNKVVQFDGPILGKQMHLGGVIHQHDQVYDLITGGSTIRCTLPSDLE